MSERVRTLTQSGAIMLAAAGLLIVMGLACIYATDTHYAAGHDGPRNAAKQLAFALTGIALGAAVIHIGYQRIIEHSYIVLIVSIASLVPLFLAEALSTTFGGLTTPRNGAYRWIQLPGFQFQPSEFFKIAFVIALAWYLRYRKNYRRFGGLLIPLVVSALPLGLILLEPDLGTVMLLLPVLLVMLLAAGARVWHVGVLCLLGVLMLPVAWTRIQGYQRARVTAVLLQSDALRQAVIENPEAYKGFASPRQALEWAASSGYQLVHSKNAIGSGGLLGSGWGEGIYATHPLLPDRHNDFVFALVSHQWGFAGAILVLLCFAIIALCGLSAALETTEPSGRLVAVGLVTLFSCQVIINVGMTLGLLPVTGMTLPFVSYGGSSLLTSCLALSLLISISQAKPFSLATKPFDYVRERIRPRPRFLEENPETSPIGHERTGTKPPKLVRPSAGAKEASIRNARSAG